MDDIKNINKNNNKQDIHIIHPHIHTFMEKVWKRCGGGGEREEEVMFERGDIYQCG